VPKYDFAQRSAATVTVSFRDVSCTLGCRACKGGELLGRAPARTIDNQAYFTPFTSGLCWPESLHVTVGTSTTSIPLPRPFRNPRNVSIRSRFGLGRGLLRTLSEAERCWILRAIQDAGSVCCNMVYRLYYHCGPFLRRGKHSAGRLTTLLQERHCSGLVLQPLLLCASGRHHAVK
jgi:hypothetical protein